MSGKNKDALEKDYNDAANDCRDLEQGRTFLPLYVRDAARNLATKSFQELEKPEAKL